MNKVNVDWVSRSQALTLRVWSFVAGRWFEGRGEQLSKYSPRDGRLLYRFNSASDQEINEAVSSSKSAFDDGRWARLPTQHRKDVLHKLATLIEAHREDLAIRECLDVGKPILDALSFDIPAAAAAIRFNAEACDKLSSKVYSVDQSSLSYQLHRPLGVVAGVVGWNFPLLLAAGKIGPALAAGNSLVLKSSELTPLSAVRVAELAIEAGVPEGVFNLIQGSGGVGAMLAYHRDVDLVTFTGSTHTGRKLLIAAGESNMKRLVLECGGKAPSIVFDDAPNFNEVADAVLARAFWNQGQVCTASSRLLIQENVRDEFLRILVEKAAASLNLGDPLKPETKFGALVSEAHKHKVAAYINSGSIEGAKLLYRSNSPPPFADGFYVPPVIFGSVSPNYRIAREEIFGPVLSVITFRNEQDAIGIANDTIYGLSAVLWTKDLGRAHRVTQGIKAGWVVVNATGKPVGGPGVGVLSVGGHKESGIGVEGGMDGLGEYTSKTAVQLFVATADDVAKI